MSWRPHLHTFAYIPRWHTSHTAMALQWRWEIWASQEGIAGFNYSLKNFLASPKSNMQMRHREHVSKPSGSGSWRRRWHCGDRQAGVRYIWARGGLRNFSDALAMSRSLADGREMGERWHECSTAMFILAGGCSITPPVIAQCQQPPSCYRGAEEPASGASESPEYKGLEFLGYPSQ